MAIKTSKRARHASVTGTAGTGPISLVLVDDNHLLRDGMATMLRSGSDFRVEVAPAEAEDAMRRIHETRPDIVLMDLGLVDHDPVNLTHRVRREVPSARVIVMGLLPVQDEVAAHIRHGASGFLMKDASPEELFTTIRAVAAGREVLPPQLTTSLFSQIIGGVGERNRHQVLDAVRLTAREREVIALLGEGLSNKEIAARMQIAVHTVKSHVHNILEKLALRSRLEVAAYTHAAGGA